MLLRKSMVMFPSPFALPPLACPSLGCTTLVWVSPYRKSSNLNDNACGVTGGSSFAHPSPAMIHFPPSVVAKCSKPKLKGHF